MTRALKVLGVLGILLAGYLFSDGIDWAGMTRILLGAGVVVAILALAR